MSKPRETAVTYAGIATILFRFAGTLFLVAFLVQLFPSIIVARTGPFGLQLLFMSSLLLFPAAILILASKPLGRLLAAGLD